MDTHHHASTRRPRVAVYTLGGTIASVPRDDGSDAVPRLSAEELLAAVPQASALADLELVSFRQFPSGDLGLRDIAALAAEIDSATNEIDGFVITQGTDTLEETSYLLDLILRTDRPVVLTGAMRNSGLPGADGPANILGALRVALSPQARGLGPLVVFSDEIHLPRFVRKTHSSSVSAFTSPNAGPIGWINEDRVRIALRPNSLTGTFDIPVSGDVPNVGIIAIGLGSPALDPAIVAAFDALVIQSFGGGHVPSFMVESLADAASTKPVVLATRTGAGEIYESTYAFPGSERDLLDRGLISSGSLDAFKARLLLTALLATGADREAVAKRFADEASQ
ncbi:hypothetical protein CH267_12845 [Rhodococcus sp. 06-621-2]|nr:asparaginase [Rhodococcus sp. 06-621-2]OZC55462.1 hypothetical protein CH267_12845 [Rhodococcus sp. 06-621-2]